MSLSYLEGKRPAAIDAIATVGPELFGDKVSTFNGSLQFEHQDLELPGNSAIPVALARRHAAGRLPEVRGIFGDWDIQLPRVTGSFSEFGWQTDTGSTDRCTGYSAPRHINNGETFQPHEFWHGTTLEVPGILNEEILRRSPALAIAPNDGHAYTLVTKSLWQIRCTVNAQNAPGQGFVAVSPEGVTYRFDWMASRYAGGVRKATAGLGRYDYSLYATRVEDRFGNFVEYSFNPTKPEQLLRITGNDGRTIVLTYSGDLVASASDGTRTMHYAYDAAGRLSTVTRPDGSRWTLALGGLLDPQREWLGEGAKCDSPGIFPSSTVLVGNITHPSGAVGTFTTRYVTHGRTYVDRHCWFVQGTSGPTTGSVYPHFTRSQTLTLKTISGPGVAPLNWEYTYGTVAGWNPCVGCPDRKTNTVKAPDGTVTRLVFGVRWRVNEGQLLETAEGATAGDALRRTTHRFRTPGPQDNCPAQFGTSPNWNGDVVSTLNRPQELKVVIQQGVSLSSRVADGNEGLDALCRPIKLTESSDPGLGRELRTRYHDSTQPYVLGQLHQRIEHDGSIETQIDYRPDALPWRRWQHGRLVQSYDYHPRGLPGSGLLWKVFDPLGRPTLMEHYHRGIPQRFVHRDGTAESAIVNNLGKVQEYTDPFHNVTTYGHDSMGRLTLIRHPAETRGPYVDTVARYEQIPFDELGLGPGHWRQTTQMGHAVTVRYYDALWRPRAVHTYDGRDITGTASRTVMQYDHDGRKTHESYPTREVYSVGDKPPGRSTTYDGLGRVTLAQQSSELGLLTTQTTYGLGPGLPKHVTDPGGFVTSYFHQAFASPDDLSIVTIDLPELARLSISRDLQGRALNITRNSRDPAVSLALTRRYSYDVHKRLCKTVEPETGATIVDYDAAGNVAWRASGVAAPGTGCDRDQVPAHRRIHFSYDVRDRVVSTAHADGSSTITQGYHPDGLLAWISASRPGTNTIVWNYHYNNRRLLEHEEYEWGDPNNSWWFTRVIDNHGHQAALQDPHGRFDFAPNALGQPTMVGPYVSHVRYHPNGAVASYTTGNGRSFSMSLNARGLPENWGHAGLLSDRLSYDSRGNVVGIADLLHGQHRSMPWYDGLGRLRDASGPWGMASYTYDVLDNLVASNVGGRSLTHRYDANNRLSGLLGSIHLDIAYDEQGNVRSRGGQTFVFDVANRLVQAPGRASYVYDGHGRRNLTWFADGSYRHDAYTQDGKLRLTWRSGQGSKRFAYLGDRLVAEHGSNGEIQYVHADYLGSPVVRSNAAGAAMESTRTRYEPYGAALAGSFNPTGIGFTGHVNDPEIGMVYMQQRYYDPVAGRFLTVDPVTTNQEDGRYFGRYHYANNNPYRFSDPDGRLPIAVVAVWILREAGAEVFEQITGVPAPSIKNLGKGAAEKVIGAALKGRTPVPGVYSFKEEGKDYVGQSKDQLKRVTQHATKGKLKKDEVKSLKSEKVEGGKLQREKVEQQKINLSPWPQLATRAPCG